MHLDRIRLIPVGFRHMTDTRPAGGERGGGEGDHPNFLSIWRWAR